MRVNMNISMQKNFINASSINNGLNINNFAINNSEQQKVKEGKDTVSISPLGKAKGLIDSLNKQKEKIIENKNELISRTLENGGSMDSIKTKLETFEEQIKNIDNQVAQITAEQLKQQAEEQKKVAYKKPKTEEEVQNERLHSMVSMSSSLNQAQVVSSVKTKVDGESRVIKMEIKLDGSRGSVENSKREDLAELQNRSANLTSDIGEDLGKVHEEIKESNEKQFIEPDYSETTKNNNVSTQIEDKKERDQEDKIGNADNNTDSAKKKSKRKE